MAACTTTEIESRYDSISFQPVAAKATKAIIDGTSYPTSESFAVSAYHNGTAEYFADLTASYSSQEQLWETSTAEYWPLGGSLTFNAYSPASAGLTISASGVSVADYTVQTAAQMTTDLCYASATVADCAQHPASVPLTFSHALSQVVFRVKAADYYNTNGSTFSLAMTSLTMDGILSVGDFASRATPLWSNVDTEHSYTLSSTSTALTYNAQNQPNTLDVCANLFIPQTLGDDACINVAYSLTQTVSGETYTMTNSPVTIGLNSTIAEWEPGKKYIYTLSIGLNNLITFTATAADWTEQGGGVVVE